MSTTLSTKAVKALQIACPNNNGSAVGAPGTDGQEIATAINTALAGFTATAAADVAAVSPGTVATITVPDNTQGSINTALASAVADIQANRTAINAILSALKTAGLMS